MTAGLPDPSGPVAAFAAPVAIGGVGGSGTRVVAQAVRSAGRNMGSDLNEALDNLWFTLLFKYEDILTCDDRRFGRLLSLFAERMATGRLVDAAAASDLAGLARRRCGQHTEPWLAERAATMATPESSAAGQPWGWKEPNTHLVLDRLARAWPDLRYVHVIRNGMDMATSSNQNQPRLWGDALGAPYDGTPAASLRYWCRAQRRATAIGATMGDRFLEVRFEDLCAAPAETFTRVLEFCGAANPGSLAARLAPSVRPPSTMGRGALSHVSTRGFDRADLDYVESLGFHVH